MGREVRVGVNGMGAKVWRLRDAHLVIDSRSREDQNWDDVDVQDNDIKP